MLSTLMELKGGFAEEHNTPWPQPLKEGQNTASSSERRGLVGTDQMESGK